MTIHDDRAPRKPGRPLGPAHPLASVAADRCRTEHRRALGLIGEVACGECWETTIRRDERVVITFGLDRDEAGDPDYLDPIAVSLACAGEPVRLTRAERRTARAQLAAAGLGPTEIGRRLSRRGTTARPPLTASDVDRVAA